jgi:zinc transport system substrate-binding protein
MIANQSRRVLPLLAITVLLIVVALGCSPQTAPAESEPPLQIVVSVLPQQYFVERIAGEHAAVTVMVPPGASPHTYEPRPEQMRALSRADAYMAVGVTFEDVWMDRITEANPDMLIVDTAEGIERMMIDAHTHDDDDHDDDYDDVHLDNDHDDDDDDVHLDDDHDDEDHEQEPDPHVWVSPRLVKVQAQHIYRALVRIDPEREAEYAANLEAFLADIDALDAEIRQALAGIENRKFIVFHPAWGYFAAEYDLEQIPIEVGGVEPGAATLAEIIRTARENDIRVILAQPEFSTEAAQTIAREINGGVQLVSPLEADWLNNMRDVARIFAEVLR